MLAIHIRNVPERAIWALRERAERRGHSMQREIREILDAAATEPMGGEAPDPIQLVTVQTTTATTWNREVIYGDQGR